MKDSNSLIEVFHIHNTLIFSSESSARYYFYSPSFEKDRHLYHIIRVVITTEKYLRRKIK